MFRFPFDRPLRPLVAACVVFLLAAVAATIMIRHGAKHDRQEERTRISNAAGDHAAVFRRNIDRALSVTYALAALVRQGNGSVSNFDAVGRQMLAFYPGVSSLSLAPGGIIGSVVPPAGNEKAIGQDLLHNPATNEEASIARESGKLTLTGPFTLVNGEMAIIGRLPVFLDASTGEPAFWGFINVVIRFPEVIETAGLPRLAERGIAYKLWRIHPETGKNEIVAASSPAAMIDPVERDFKLASGNWILAAAPVEGWGDPVALGLNVALGLLLSLLLAWLAKLLVESRAHARGLEAQVVQRTAEVQAREAELNRAQAMARVGSWVFDYARNELRGSPEALRIVGMSAGEPFSFEAFMDCVHPDDRNAVEHAWQAAWKGEPYDIEYRLVHETAIRWVHSNAELTFEADGTRRRALGTVQDITERKNTESALRESEARFRLTFDLAGSGIAHVDMDGRFLHVNRSLCAILGYSDKELVGHAVQEFSHPEDRDRTDAARARVLSGELDSTRFQKRYLRKDGKVVWVNVTVALVHGDEGKPLYEIAVFDDDTERKRAESALHESEMQFRRLTEMSSDFYWESDEEHRITQRTAGPNSGASSEFWQGAQIDKRRWEVPYLSPDEAGWRAHRAVLDAHRPFRNFELSRAGADGTEYFRSISGDPVFDASGAFKGYRGVGSDITARKRAEQALRESAEKLRLFADNVPAMTVSFDENLRLVFVNKRYADFFGYGAAEILGKHLREIVGARVYSEIEGYFVRALQGHPVTYQRIRKPQHGESRYLEIKLFPQIGDQGKILGCFVVAADITEHKQTEERIQRVAHHDSLTGLPNRLLFNDRLSHAISLAKRDSSQFALLYLDLDKFKPVNDTLGHTAGDELLRGVAERIQQHVRQSDTVARVGGDEFTVILPDITKRENAEIVARKIIAALATPFQLDTQKQSVAIGSSIGIALYPTDAEDADALIKAADGAMYRAKQSGNSFRFCLAQAGTANPA